MIDRGLFIKNPNTIEASGNELAPAIDFPIVRISGQSQGVEGLTLLIESQVFQGDIFPPVAVVVDLIVNIPLFLPLDVCGA